MAETRLSGTGQGRSIQAVLASVRSNGKLSALLGRLAALSNLSQDSRNMFERIVATDKRMETALCHLLSQGFYAEPGLVFSDLSHAIQNFGLEAVRHASEAVSVHAMAAEGWSRSHLSSRDYWIYASASAAGAGVLGRALDLPVCRAQIAGLLRDTGVIFVASTFPEDYANLVKMIAGSPAQLSEAERDFMGWDHFQAAKLVFASFGFGPDILAAVSEEPVTSSSTPLAKCASLATSIARQLGCSMGVGNLAPNLDWKSVESLGFGEDDLAAAVEIVSSTVPRLARISI